MTDRPRPPRPKPIPARPAVQAPPQSHHTLTPEPDEPALPSVNDPSPAPARRTPSRVTFQQRLFLTMSQETHLLGMWRLAQDVDRVVTLYHRHHAAGQSVKLSEVAAHVLDRSGTLPALPFLDTVLHDPRVAIKPFMREFRALARVRGWDAHADLMTLEAVVRDRCRVYREAKWAGATLRSMREADLVTRDLSLTTRARSLDPVSVHLSVLGQEGNAVVDGDRLPGRFLRAFQQRRETSARSMARDLAVTLDVANRGEAWATERVASLRRTYPHLTPDASTQDAQRSEDVPLLEQNAQVKQVTGPDGQTHVVLEWTFDLRGCTFEPWIIDDALGVDVGERFLYAIATGDGQHLVRSALHGRAVLPDTPEHGVELAEWNLTYGTPLSPVMTGEQAALRRETQWRHLNFTLVKEHLNDLVNACLLHRLVGFEDLDLASLRRVGTFPAFLERSGLWDAMQWVETLAPLHRVSVHRVNPRRSTKTCAACGTVNKAPGSDKVFLCLKCGWEEHSDLNAAHVIRQRTFAAANT